MKPNQKVLEAMLKNTFYHTNFPLLAFICESYQTCNLPVNKGFLERTEKFLLDIRSKILDMVRINNSNSLDFFSIMRISLGACECQQRSISTIELIV